MARRLSQEQRQSLMNKVDALRTNGMSATAACKKAKVSIFNYNYWKRTLGKKLNARRVLKTEMTKGMRAFNVNLSGGKNQPMVIAIGQPKDVSAALKNLATIFGGN